MIRNNMVGTPIPPAEYNHEHLFSFQATNVVF